MAGLALLSSSVWSDSAEFTPLVEVDPKRKLAQGPQGVGAATCALNRFPLLNRRVKRE